jgi:hypothetical protein
MGKLWCVAVALVLASPLAACGAGSDDTRARQPVSPYATNRPQGPPTETEMGPSPQNMPGGGRGSDPPHFKGKP